MCLKRAVMDAEKTRTKALSPNTMLNPKGLNP